MRGLQGFGHGWVGYAQLACGPPPSTSPSRPHPVVGGPSPTPHPHPHSHSRSVCQFALEVVDAVTAAIGAERVGIRLSPFANFLDASDSTPYATHMYLVRSQQRAVGSRQQGVWRGACARMHVRGVGRAEGTGLVSNHICMPEPPAVPAYVAHRLCVVDWQQASRV